MKNSSASNLYLNLNDNDKVLFSNVTCTGVNMSAPQATAFVPHQQHMMDIFMLLISFYLMWGCCISAWCVAASFLLAQFHTTDNTGQAPMDTKLFLLSLENQIPKNSPLGINFNKQKNPQKNSKCYQREKQERYSFFICFTAQSCCFSFLCSTENWPNGWALWSFKWIICLPALYWLVEEVVKALTKLLCLLLTW